MNDQALFQGFTGSIDCSGFGRDVLLGDGWLWHDLAVLRA